jgi:hypothetical protein
MEVISFSSTQLITIRVLNENNGEPLEKKKVSISMFYEKGVMVPAGHPRNLVLETNVSGEVKFSLPEPVPAKLIAVVDLSKDHWQGSYMLFVNTQEVMQRGRIHSLSKSNKSVSYAKAGPGEILFLARPEKLSKRLFGIFTE